MFEPPTTVDLRLVADAVTDADTCLVAGYLFLFLTVTTRRAPKKNS